MHVHASVNIAFNNVAVTAVTRTLKQCPAGQFYSVACPASSGRVFTLQSDTNPALASQLTGLSEGVSGHTCNATVVVATKPAGTTVGYALLPKANNQKATDLPQQKGCMFCSTMTTPPDG